MKQIESLAVLNEERLRVKKRLVELENLIEQDMEIIRQDLRTLRAAGHVVKNFLVTSEDGVIGVSIGAAVDVLIKKILFRKSGWLTKFILSFILKNTAKNLLLKKTATLFENLKSMMSATDSVTH
jgi:hypothetical protein